MSELPIQQGGLRVLSGIVPASSASTYGTHYSYLGVGGYVEVPNIDYRNSIPPDSNMNDEGYSTGRRRYGMMVYVIDEDKLYRLFPFSGGSVVSMETFTGTSELNQVTMLSNNNGWIEVPDLSVLITGGTYFSGNSSIVLYDSTGGTVSITGITTTDIINPGDGRVLVSTGNSENIFVAQSNMVFNGTNLNITGGTFITDSSGSLHSSAIIQFKSTTKGVLLPGMTTSQKNAIVNPTTGLTVYDSTIEDISVYTSSGWTGVIAERDDLQKVTERGNSTNSGLIISGTTYLVGSGSTTGNTFVTSNSANTQTFTIKDNGNILIGTTTDAGYKLDVNGTGRFQSDLLITSPGRLYFTDTVNAYIRASNNRIWLGVSSQEPFVVDAAQNQSVSSLRIGSFVNASTSNGLTVAITKTASGGKASSISIENTLVAAANNDVLVGLDINPTFTNGAFTGLSNLAARIQGNLLIGTSLITGVTSNIQIKTIDSTLSMQTTSNTGYTGVNMYNEGNTLVGSFQIGNSSVGIPSLQNNFFFGARTSTGRTIIIRGSNATPSMTVFSTGNVLIQDGGTHTDAGYKLDVSGSTRIVGSGSTSGSTAFSVQNSTGGTLLNLFSNGNLNVDNGVLYVDGDNGRVGIGITSPTYKLQVGDFAINSSNKIVIATANSGVNGFYVYAGASNYVRTAIEHDYGTSLTRFMGSYNTGTNIIGQDGNNGHTILYSGPSSSERVRVVGSNGNVLIGTTTDAGYKLDVNGTTRISNTLRVVGSVGYGSNVFEFGVNGGTGQNGYINGFGQWFISNGGTNTRAATIGSDILFLGQQTASPAIQLSNPNNVIGQWSGIPGTYNNTTTSETIIVVNNQASANLYGMTIAGDQSSGQLSSKNLLTLSHWGNSGVQTFGSTSASQFYNLINVNISVVPTQPNKTLRGFYYNPTISGTTLANHNAIEVVTGNVLLGTTSGNVLIGRTTDFGYRLDVSGTTRVVSTGSTSGSTIFTLQNSTSGTTTEFRSDGVIGISSASTFTTQVTSVISASTTNSGIAIVPNGTGAFTLNIPDGTAVGGTARGTNAVDLQMSRTSASSVAAWNYDSILGGRSNYMSANADGYRVIGGGFNNQISVAGYSFIGGGSTNIISGGGSAYNSILGGLSNTASSSYSIVIGGSSNTASGQYSIAGGQSNTSSGSHAVSFGSFSTASALQSFAVGTFATASGWRSFAQGQDVTASADFSMAKGYRATAYLYGQTSFANSSSAGYQQSYLTSWGSFALTSGSTVTLSLDGSGTANLIIPNGNNRAWNVVVNTITVCTVVSGGALTVGDAHAGEYKFLFKRVGGTSTISPITTSSEVADTSMATASFSFSAGTSQQMAITFNAPNTANNSTFRAVAKVALTEVAW